MKPSRHPEQAPALDRVERLQPVRMASQLKDVVRRRARANQQAGGISRFVKVDQLM